MPNANGSSQRVVLIAGAALVIALVAFSVLRSTHTPTPAELLGTQTSSPQSGSAGETSAPQTSNETQTAAAMPPMASPRASAPLPVVTSPLLTEREPTKEEVVGVPRSKPEDVLQQFEAKSVTLIDVRAADDYKERHIPGAMHVPLAYIDGEVPYLPRDKPIVTYCT
jgi:hypothetical protein